jgi:hypothetical protein
VVFLFGHTVWRDESLIAFGVPSFAAFNKLLMNGGLNDVAPV